MSLAALSWPHTPLAEEEVLGGVLVEEGARQLALTSLEESDFYLEPCRLVFAAARRLYELGRPVRAVSVGDMLAQMGVLSEVGGMAFVMGLTQRYSFNGFEDSLEIVRDAGAQRAAMHAALDVLRTAQNRTHSGAELIDYASETMHALSRGRQPGTMVEAAEGAKAALAALRAKAERGGGLVGLSTGFTELDALLGGFQPGNLYVLAARPSMGKSALSLQFATAAALADHPALFFSLEMSSEQLFERAVCAEARVAPSRVVHNAIAPRDWERLERAAEHLASKPLTIDDAPGATLPYLRAQARKKHAAHPLGLIVVDYLQLIASPGTKGATRNDEVGAMSRGLKLLARELEVPVVVLSQLSRSVESRPNKRPQLSDLRDSGAIEQDADVVMFIYRDEYYDPDSEQQGVAEVIVAKQRGGAVGKVELQFSRDMVRFSNLAR